MWRGAAQHRGTHKLRKWFQWVYLAAFNGNPQGENKIENHCQHLRFKIGKAQNLRVRGKQLIVESNTGEILGDLDDDDADLDDDDDDDDDDDEERSRGKKKSTKLIKWSKDIVYAFSVPRPLMFETRIKRFVYNFIDKNLTYGGTKVQYASEIVQGIAFEPLVHIIQLCILEGCLYHNYIKLNDDEQIFRQYVGDIMKYPPDRIKWDGNAYYGRKWGYHQTMTLTISTNVKKTVNLTLNSKNVRQRIKSIKLSDDFDLMKDVVNLSGNSPKFVQYVFDVTNNDSRMNHINKPSDSPSHLSFSTTAEDAPNNSFAVGDLAFAIFEKDSDGHFPCEIVGYWNGQFVVRWIDRRRFDTVARKWIEYDSNAHKLYKRKHTLHTLSDFLKDEVVAVGNKYLNKPVVGNRYRDYIELIDHKDSDEEDTQPTEALVPTFYRKVGEEYKNLEQLRTWNYMKYGDAFAPSRHWKTRDPVENKPINPKFKHKTEAQLNVLEIEKEQKQLDQEQQRNEDDEDMPASMVNYSDEESDKSADESADESAEESASDDMATELSTDARVVVIDGKYLGETGRIAKVTNKMYQLELDSAATTATGKMPMVKHKQVAAASQPDELDHVEELDQEVGMTAEEAINQLKFGTQVQKINGSKRKALVTRVPSTRSGTGKFGVGTNQKRNQRPGSWKISKTNNVENN